MNRREILLSALKELHIQLPETAIERLLTYVELLVKWNQTYNLTAIRTGDDMVTQHLLDSLAILPYLEHENSLADIGSGAGLPGIPLAIARTDLMVTLIDSVQKKSAFQRQAKIDLALSNVSIYSGRIELFKVSKPFDAVAARAFSDLTTLVRVAAPLLPPEGRIYAMKGMVPPKEIDGLPPEWKIASINELKIPGLNAERHLLVIERQ